MAPFDQRPLCSRISRYKINWPNHKKDRKSSECKNRAEIHNANERIPTPRPALNAVDAKSVRESVRAKPQTATMPLIASLGRRARGNLN